MQHYEETIYDIRPCMEERFSNLVVSPVFNNIARFLVTSIWLKENVAMFREKDIIKFSHIFKFYCNMENVIRQKFLMSGKCWRRFYDYQQQIFWLSWNFKTYVYRSQGKCWQYECFTCHRNIVNYTFYKCESWMFSWMVRIKTE